MKTKMLINLGLCRFTPMLSPDTGANGGAENGEVGTNEPGKDEEGQEPEAKTFTQEELDSIVKERIARAKKGQPSKEELDAFKQWQESQKTEEEKKNDALTNAEKARLAAEEKVTALEAKVTCLSKGVTSTCVDDVVILAKAMITDELTIEQAIDKVLEKYPSFKGEVQKEEAQQNQNGFKIGAGASGTKGNNDALAKIFGNK